MNTIIALPDAPLTLQRSTLSTPDKAAIADTPTLRLADTPSTTLSRSTLSTPPEEVQLKYFTDPSILQQLGYDRLARFFQEFELEMRDAGNRLPFPSPD